MPLEVLGGPGSGRYPKGSGQNPQSGPRREYAGDTGWDEWKNSGGWEESHLTAIDDEGNIVGGADVTDTGKTMFIQMIYVDTDRQGEGHGKAMLREIVREANRRGRTTISGESSSDSYRRVADKMLGEPVIHGNPNYYKDEEEGVMVVHTIPPEMRTLGGPGSGRYPKGSGQNPQSGFVLNHAALETEEGAEAEFQRAIAEQYPDGLVVYHESPIESEESIRQHGLDADSFATIGKPSDFVVTPRKVIVEAKLSPAESRRVTPDMRYYGIEGSGHAALLREHNGVHGADVSLNNPTIPPSKLTIKTLGGPGSGRYPKGSGKQNLVGGKTFAQRFPKGILKPKPELTGAERLLSSPFVEVTDEPRSTMFILPDGRRVGPVKGTGFEMLHMELAQGGLGSVMKGGVIRYSRGEGIETQVVPTHEQAQVIADDFKYIWKTRLFIDANDGEGMGNHERIEDNRLTPDGIRNTVRKLLETKNSNPRWLGGPGSGRYPKGSGQNPQAAKREMRVRESQGIRWAPPTTEEEWNQEMLAISQESPAAHPTLVLGMHPKLDGETMRYVAAYGQDFQTVPLPKFIHKGNPQECYKNASILVARHPELTYAEGFAQTKNSNGVAFLHGWAVTPDGLVIDPTYGDEGHSYFGVQYDRTSYLKQLQRSKHYGVVAGTYKTTKAAVSTGAPNLRSEMKTLGGPGSGRYPKGSGKQGKESALIYSTREAEKLYRKFTGDPNSSLEDDLHESFQSRPDSHVSIRVVDMFDEIDIKVIGQSGAGTTHVAHLILRQTPFSPLRKQSVAIDINAVEVMEEKRSSNIAIETLRGIHQLAEKSGAEHIKMIAGSTHGGYAWAKIGATAREPELLADGIRQNLGMIRYDYGDSGANVVLDALREHEGNPKLPWILASLRTPEGRLMGPGILRGSQWEAKFNMKDPEARKRFKRLVYREGE